MGFLTNYVRNLGSLLLGRQGHFPILITNGWYVNEENAKEILDAGLQEISVSVNYASAEKHDALRGKPGAWDRALRVLDMLHRTRSDRRNRVHMISVLMDDNLDDIEPMIEISKDLGVTYMLSLYSWNRGTKRRRLPHEKVTAKLLELKRKHPEFVTLSGYIEHLDEAIEQGGIGDCQAGRLLMNIDHKGDVARCTETLDEPVGNLLCESGPEIRDKLIARADEHDCAECWTSCRGFVETMTKRTSLGHWLEFHNSVKKV